MKLEHIFTAYTKINSKCHKNLNIRHETIKLLEKNISKTVSDINLTSVFFSQSTKALEIKAKIDRWDLLISFCTVKEMIKQKDILQTGRIYLQMMQPTRA